MIKIKDQLYIEAFLNTEMCKVGKARAEEIIVHRAKGDIQDKSGNFVRDTLRLKEETRAAHASPIMKKNRNNMKQFRAHPVHGTVEELWTAFHKYVKRILLANTERQGEFLPEKMVQWLHEKQQPTAALWFEKYWTGKRGRWTFSHAGHANLHTNSRLEGHIG